MTAAEFARLIRNGHGRAILYARGHDVRAFREVILAACRHSQSIEPVTNGTQADYMWTLLLGLPDRQFYCDEVQRALPSGGDDWDARHRFTLVRRMAEGGDERARQAMYEAFAPGPRHGDSIATNFVCLDGLKGFLFAAGRLGQLFLADPKASKGSTISMAREVLGEDVVDAALADRRMEGFRVHSVERSTDDWARINALGYDSLDVRSLSGIRLTGWGKRAPESEIVKAARGLTEAGEASMQAAHLNIFRWRAFPGDVMHVVRLAESANPKVAWAAIGAVRLLTHPAIRDLAFRMIAGRSPHRGESIGFLEHNFQPGDHRLALDWYAAETEDEAIHRMGFGLSYVWEAHPDPSTHEEMLREQYEKQPCGACRECVVRALIKLGALSGEWRAECSEDAFDETRELVGAA